VALSPRLAGYDNLILDLDGCVYVGVEPTPGAVEAIDELRAAGKGVSFVTNDPRHSGEDYVRRLWRMGIRASLTDVVTVGAATQHLLAETRPGRTAFVIGTEAMRKHVGDAGLQLLNDTELASRAEVVVVAGTEDLVYDDLKQASLAVRAGADFVAAGRDSTYPTEHGLWPGTGAILAAVECASGRRATIVGKPEPQLFETAIDRLGPGRTLVVGDRLDADVAAAARLRLDAALVLTGATTAEEAAAAEDPAPTIVSPSLSALVDGRG
jgi:HAD superfamily hydrolase (TIGR01450 family)